MKHILAWSDAPTAGTGFGNVNLYVLSALVNSGRYLVEQLGLNCSVGSDPTPAIPWRVLPAASNESSDFLGHRAFLEKLSSGEYDLVWILNDPFVVAPLASHIQQALSGLAASGRPPPQIIFYYPIDCQLRARESALVAIADAAVANTEFGRQATLKVLPHKAVHVIPHGIDLSVFKPLSGEARTKIRRNCFGADDSTIVFMNASRNTVRKQLAQTILAFSLFKQQHPNSKLYLHTPLPEQKFGLDLFAAAEDLGLTPTDVIFPLRYTESNPLPASALNEFYNAVDAFITTSLGEGWGFSHLEAMAAGIPAICPDHTAFHEQLAEGVAGYLYPCRDRIWVDNSGFRPLARIEDLLAAMESVFNDVQNARSAGIQLKKAAAALNYVNQFERSKVCKQWVELFDRVTAA